MQKKFHLSSAALVTLFGSLAAFGWTDFVSAHTAAIIVTGLGAAKALLTVIESDGGNAA